MQSKYAVYGIKTSRFVKEQKHKNYWVIYELKHH